jgi:hypothetical protein
MSKTDLSLYQQMSTVLYAIKINVDSECPCSHKIVNNFSLVWVKIMFILYTKTKI